MPLKSETEVLQDRLDELWADYLGQLDRYQAAQSRIIENFSKGFISLAQANYKSSAGRRYGRDFYDDRMKACRRCRLEDSAGLVRLSMEQVEAKASLEDDDEENDSKTLEKAEEGIQQEQTPPATPVSDEVTKEDDVSSETDQPQLDPGHESPDDPIAKTTVPDPLHWYGILVPRELRNTQSSFSAAIDENIGPAVTSAKSMREIEFEIRKTRKALKKAEKERVL
ncbi:Hypothetical protein R9X50_00447100 [Acrodontium crateriforme]|uniref:Vacuolar ATPase assembly protein VMA22 n=1 Tax=Acrodontium crateriforme TaxID=150365 RepID=A0AAQ3MB12_9PEZI|nr:Hypothetical protein R9X50_00447100 [Acrodontium crateriforme]